jgi:prevent-host-death family protein
LVNLTNVGASRWNEFVTKQVNLYEAKTHLSGLVEEAANGAEIVIARTGKPAARLVAFREKAVRPKKRKPGLSKIHFVETKHRKTADAEIAQEFEN